MVAHFRAIAFLCAAFAASGCSTVESRMGDPPIFDRTTTTSMGAFHGCLVRATANQNVTYLPRENGGTFKATAGPQEYVLWLVNIDDLKSERRITIHAVDSIWGPDKGLIAKVKACID